ncbi:MAG: hypothetical protein ABIC40_05225 [bacterium]
MIGKPFPFADIANSVGVGYDWPYRYNAVIGWLLENVVIDAVSIGWQTGLESGKSVSAGYTLQGPNNSSVSVGWKLKVPSLRVTPLGYSIASPSDSRIGIAYSAGTVDSGTVNAGFVLLGLCELGIRFVCLDQDSMKGFASDAAVSRQKNVILNGTTPEELD